MGFDIISVFSILIENLERKREERNIKNEK